MLRITLCKDYIKEINFQDINFALFTKRIEGFGSLSHNTLLEIDKRDAKTHC